MLEKKINMGLRKVIYYILIVMITYIFGVAVMLDKTILALLMVLCLWCVLFEKSIYEMKSNPVPFAFFVCYFTLLMGSLTLKIFNGKKLPLFDSATYMHIALCLYLGLFFFEIGFAIAKKINLKLVVAHGRSNILTAEQYYVKWNNVRNLTKVLYYMTAVFQLLINIERILFVQATSYLSYYIDYESHLPGIFSNLAAMSNTFMMIYLACMPRKKEARLPLLLYFFTAVINLGYGQRNGLVLVLAFFVIYFTIRDNLYSYGERWITPRMKVLALMSMPVMIAFLFSFNYLREGMDSGIKGLGNQIIAFFDEIGGSYNVIGYGKVHKESLNPNVHYSLAGLVNVVKDNRLFKVIFGTQTYTGQTVDMALYGNNYAAALTYVVMPWNYEIGIGVGSCYLAEAYHDFGYVGIAVLSILYGIISNKSMKVIKNTPYFIGCLFIVVTAIIYAPRAGALNFFEDIFSMTNIFALLVVYALAKRKIVMHRELDNVVNCGVEK